jgi:hypothetical protein
MSLYRSLEPGMQEIKGRLNMRQIMRSLVGMAVTGAAIAMMRRLSRSRNMRRQQNFRRLDDVIKGPKGW